MLIFRNKETLEMIDPRDVDFSLDVREVFGDEFENATWDDAMLAWTKGAMNIDALDGFEIVSEATSNDN